MHKLQRATDDAKALATDTRIVFYSDTVKLRVIVARVPSHNSIFTVLRARPVQHNFIIQTQDKMYVVCMHRVSRIGLTHETMCTQ